VPGFAREAVAAEQAYMRAWNRSLAGVVRVLEGGPKPIGEVVSQVAREQAVDQVVVHTAISRLLRRRVLQDMRPDRLALAGPKAS